ncbi:MAG: accessory Sec system translocase SecA2 [Candidatus Cohnella colombiensis]|uniref:Protein translocase subunit SecA n=1 Tax=Candidatus Cohnella colombiensis TaxID=3121368 RepID=A0AA95F1D1_9BACL|nr:MAG: accessory Sec system translocase SecA2 [Cohnella sp.]
MNFASKFVQKLKGRFAQNKLKPYMDTLEEIKQIDLSSWDDGKLQAKAAELRDQALNNVPLDELLVEAYALVCEAAWRKLRMRPYDVQIMAGLALHEGNLIEMQTGEGKTLAAVLSAYLNALPGRGVHVLTFNDYLAGRDAAWMGPIYEFLGLQVAAVREGMSTQQKQEAYSADITYVTAKEMGFDYLRDEISTNMNDIVHRPFHYVIVDEADSLLIDEARVPLIIAGSVPVAGNDGRRMAELAASLSYGDHYDFDENKRNVFLTETGVEYAESVLKCGNLYDNHNSHLLTSLNCALHADALLKRDVDYIIRDGKLELIDPFTGRVAENRHWPDGLQAAVEAKEGMSSNLSGKILGTITLQHLLSIYPKISGMTATALASEDEFDDTYSLNVVQIASNRPCIREDLPSLIFTHFDAKLKALVTEIASVHATGRPILIGTSSVDESDKLAQALQESGVACHVLNAKNDAEEAVVIAKAGKLNAVTVSTNMAGRGVDIRLGGGDPIEAEKVAKLNGLYVIGTHMNESIRIDNQLRGRAGRQGDPGSSRFYVSLEDEIFVRFGYEKAIPASYRSIKQDEPLVETSLNKSLEHFQRVVTGQNFDIRKDLNKYMDMVEEQRKIIHEQRMSIINVDNPISPAEKHVTLFYLDKAWADHLAYVSYIREGIHLESLANRNPIDEFHHRIIHAFEQIPEKIEQETAKLMRRIDQQQQNIDWDKLGLKGPSRTWTYMMNDQYIQKKVDIFG